MANGDLIFILFHHFWTRMPLCVGIPGIVSGLAKNNPTKAHKSQVYMGYMLSYKHGLTTTYNSWVAHQKKRGQLPNPKKNPSPQLPSSSATRWFRHHRHVAGGELDSNGQTGRSCPRKATWVGHPEMLLSNRKKCG